MSDAAMERRIKKIRRVDKMESLILVSLLAPMCSVMALDFSFTNGMTFKV